MDLSTLSEIEIQFKLERLLAEYVQCIDDDRLELWPEFFVDRCIYKILALENAARGMPLAAIFCDSKNMLIDRVVSLRKANVYERHQYRHIVSSTIVSDVSATSAKMRSNYAVYRTRGQGVTELYSAGIYEDSVVVVDDRLLFEEKNVIYDTDRIDTLLVTPL
ncbi:MAG: anthranilate 1,2-dioxygenase small subunit [Gammaproteobacteria bacterium]|jgi:anthranilate 1,2-dioxygenase small subunit